MRLSIIVPMYNEERTILDILKVLHELKLPVEKEIIIVDDGSKDKSVELVEKHPEYYDLFLKHEKNKGKGAAVMTGIQKSTGELIIIQDADLEYDPNDYPKLLKPIMDNETDVVFGSRFLRKHKAKYKAFYIGNKVLSFATSALHFKKVTDMETCYKMFRRSVIEDMTIHARGFEFEPELTSKILKAGHKIVEVPIWYQCRDFEEGKKITWKDGVKALWYLLKYRFMD